MPKEYLLGIVAIIYSLSVYLIDNVFIKIPEKIDNNSNIYSLRSDYYRNEIYNNLDKIIESNVFNKLKTTIKNEKNEHINIEEIITLYTDYMRYIENMHRNAEYIFKMSFEYIIDMSDENGKTVMFKEAFESDISFSDKFQDFIKKYELVEKKYIDYSTKLSNINNFLNNEVKEAYGKYLTNRSNINNSELSLNDKKNKIIIEEINLLKKVAPILLNGEFYIFDKEDELYEPIRYIGEFGMEAKNYYIQTYNKYNDNYNKKYELNKKVNNILNIIITFLAIYVIFILDSRRLKLFLDKNKKRTDKVYNKYFNKYFNKYCENKKNKLIKKGKRN